MFHQFSTWWRALSVVLLGLATLTWPSAAYAAATPSFSVISQDAVANMSAAGTSSFRLDLSVPTVNVTDVTLALYSPLVYRSQVSSIDTGEGVTTPSIATTVVTNPTCQSGTTLDLTVSVFSANGTGTSHRCGDTPLHLRLPCAASACDGVYPLAIKVTVGDVAHVEWSLLALHVAPVTQPLKVNYVFVVDPSSWANPALAEANFATLARFASVPLTLAVDYRPLADAILSTSRQKWKSSLTSALKSSQHRAIVAPSPLIDMAGLAANGFPGEVARQVTLGNHLLQTITGRGTDGPILVSDPTSPAALNALARAGVSDIVVSDNALTVAPSNTLTWGAPFDVTGASGVTALATDGGLTQLASDSAIEPGRRAALTLATLAFLHFEAPNASAPRTVVVPINVGLVSPTYVDDLLGASASNPFVTPSTLTPSFDPTLVGTNASPVQRVLAPTGESVWSPNNVSTLRSLIQRTESFVNSIQSSTEPIALQTSVALTEQTGGPAAREGVLQSATSSLNAQLGSFRIDDSTITLTGSSTVLPITIFSSAHYPVILLLHLSTDRLSFPQGDPVAVALNTATTPLRIPATDRVAGGLTLQLELTTKDGSLIVAQAPVQVRVAGNSVVGYLLSGASLFVLAWWWLRTYRRKSRGRHSR
jgi:hypothetical protein